MQIKQVHIIRAKVNVDLCKLRQFIVYDIEHIFLQVL